LVREFKFKGYSPEQLQTLSIEALIPLVMFPPVLLPLACVIGPVEFCCADTEATATLLDIVATKSTARILQTATVFLVDMFNAVIPEHY